MTAARGMIDRAHPERGVRRAKQVAAQKVRKIRRLRAFEALSAVMATGSISAAARQMKMSQPAVSQLIRNLEDAIGAPLFVRRNGAIFPTRRSESLNEDISELLAQIERIEMHLSHRATHVVADIRLSATVTICTEILPILVTELHRVHPQGRFFVNALPLDAMTSGVAEGHVDFAFHTRPLNHPSVRNRVLCEVPQVCVLRADHPLAKKDVISVQDIRDMPVVLPSRNDPNYTFYRDLFHEKRVRAKVVVQSPYANVSIDMARRLNLLSFNNSLFATLLCERWPDLVWRPVSEIDMRTTFYLSYSELMDGTETLALVERCFSSALSDAIRAATGGRAKPRARARKRPTRP